MNRIQSKKSKKLTKHSKVSATQKSKSKKNVQTKKKISITQSINKFVNVIKPKKHDNKQQNNCKSSNIDVPFAEGSSQLSYSKFFYTNEHNLETFDDQQLYQLLSSHYPGISTQSQNASIKKNAIIAVLNDVKLMQKVLDEYNMTVLDFFKFLFRLCPSVFKGLFIKKIQKTLKGKPYAQALRFGKYSFTKHDTRKKCSIL